MHVHIPNDGDAPVSEEYHMQLKNCSLPVEQVNPVPYNPQNDLQPDDPEGNYQVSCYRPGRGAYRPSTSANGMRMKVMLARLPS